MKRRERAGRSQAMPVILPRPESIITSCSTLGPYFTDSDGNIHFAGSANTFLQSFTTHVPVETSPKSQQKIILPKLPAGVKPPSKIIVINNNRDAGPPKVHVINTSKAGSQAFDEELRKRRVMTGELHIPKNILPKPEPLVLRTKKPFYFTAPSGSLCVPKIAIAKLPVPKRVETSTPVGRAQKKLIHKFIEDTASDGFEVYPDDASGSNATVTLHLQQLPLNELEKTQITLPRAIRPKPPPLAPRIQLSDGTILPSIQPKEVPVITQEELLRRVFSLVPSQPPDPDEFRPPKRKRSKRGTSRSGVDKAMLPEVGSHKRRTGRPSRLRKPTGDLLEEMGSDCLAVASDGLNVKCVACNVILTKDGSGYPRQILKHLHQIKSHQSNYEQWKFRQDVNAEPSYSSSHSDSSMPRSHMTTEVSRSRGRHKRTPLSFITEFNSPWLEITADGQTLFCKACEVPLVGEGHNMRRSDIYRHLSRDASHHEKVGLYEVLHGTVEGVLTSEQDTAELVHDDYGNAPHEEDGSDKAFTKAQAFSDSEMEEPTTEE